MVACADASPNTSPSASTESQTQSIQRPRGFKMIELKGKKFRIGINMNNCSIDELKHIIDHSSIDRSGKHPITNFFYKEVIEFTPGTFEIVLDPVYHSMKEYPIDKTIFILESGIKSFEERRTGLLYTNGELRAVNPTKEVIEVTFQRTEDMHHHIFLFLYGRRHDHPDGVGTCQTIAPILVVDKNRYKTFIFISEEIARKNHYLDQQCHSMISHGIRNGMDLHMKFKEIKKPIHGKKIPTK